MSNVYLAGGLPGRLHPVTVAAQNKQKVGMSRIAHTTYLKNYQPSAWLVERVDLVFDLHDDHSLVRARLSVRRNPDGPGGPLVLVGEDVELAGLSVDGAVPPADRWQLRDGELVVEGLADQAEVEVLTRIHPDRNTELSGLYFSDGMYCTQCEAEGFRRITFYLDRPDVMALFTTTIQADKARYPVLLSNGNLVEEGVLEGGRHFARWEDPFPKPCYLFALVAGDLRFIQDHFTTASGREVTLRIFTEERNVHKCDFAMESLKRAMVWDEQVYGREYDLDIFMIVAVDAFNMGAMENKGLNIFNASLVLAEPAATTDSGFAAIEGVVAHEYFHNWTGNRITCRDWFQITLKEGLTVFRDQEFSSDMGSRAVCRIGDVGVLRARQFPEDASPMAHAIQPVSYQKIDNFYTATVYEKGAEIIRMMHTLVGPEGYRKGTDLYFQRHDGQAVTTEDFVAALEAGSGVDLAQFRRWYRQVGTPRVAVTESWDPNAGELVLAFTQEVPGWSGDAQGPLHIPIAMGLLDDQGRELPVQLKGEAARPAGTFLLELREAAQAFTFTGLAARPHISLLRGFSAPVKLERDVPDSELAFLLAHDPDPFSRYEAGQRLYTGSLKAGVAALRSRQPLTVDPMILDAWRSLLADADADPQYFSMALSFPGYGDLEQEYDIVPVTELIQALDFHIQVLARTFRADLLAIHDRYRRELLSRPYSRSSRDEGMRSLQNFCLGMLKELSDPEITRLAFEQYKTATCMSDTMTALSCLAQTDCPEGTEALGDFAKRWHDNPVVMNSWFAVQAASRREDVLDRVADLLTHPAFDLRNPNKVRSLLGAFAGNVRRFHDSDGRAYRFFTDNLLQVDALNSHMGAALVRQLMHWRRHEPARSAMMKAQLERVASQAGLSPNAFEIASKSLGA